MANPKRRRLENVPGDFYVDETCIDCDQCRAIAPETFHDAGDKAAVYRQPQDATARITALKALVTCPTGSIGTLEHHDMAEAVAAYPERIEDEVHFCGFAAESSFGASSYLILRPEGKVLVDSPRFAGPLVRRIESLGGVRTLFLTHVDDVADHARWAKHFGASRILHRADRSAGLAGVERWLDGTAPVVLDPDLLAIPTPGHTAGHTVLLYRQRFLFSGDHLWWSPTRQRLVASRSVAWYSWPEQLRSVAKLVDHPCEWVLPGHGRRFHGPAAIIAAQLRDIVARG